MKKIIAVYQMTVYDDGSIQLEPLAQDAAVSTESAVKEEAALEEEDYTAFFDHLELPEVTTILSPPSQRIRQIMWVVSHANALVSSGLGWQGTPFASLNKIINRCYRDAAAHFSVSPQTIADKTLRQLNIQKADFVRALQALFTQCHTLEDVFSSTFYHLLEQASAASADDLVYANQAFSQLFSDETFTGENREESIGAEEQPFWE